MAATCGQCGFKVKSVGLLRRHYVKAHPRYAAKVERKRAAAAALVFARKKAEKAAAAVAVAAPAGVFAARPSAKAKKVQLSELPTAPKPPREPRVSERKFIIPVELDLAALQRAFAKMQRPDRVKLLMRVL